MYVLLTSQAAKETIVLTQTALGEEMARCNLLLKEAADRSRLLDATEVCFILNFFIS